MIDESYYRPLHRWAAPRAAGFTLAAALGAAAMALAAAQQWAMGRTTLDGLVIAILLGTAVRTLAKPGSRFDMGVQFASRELLEVAVLLLGASVDLALLLKAGPSLAVSIVLLVVVGISVSYGIGRLLGLPHALAVLIACGNSICGNSAIVAVAPVIGAAPEEVASAVAFTAILGIAVVTGLPLLAGPLHLSFYQYGVLAGLTVYAVPQVLAAAFPVSALSGQVATLVKLIRVLMLGPVVVFFALQQRRARAANNFRPSIAARTTQDNARVTRYVPWFITGFLLLAASRSAGLVPHALIAPAHTVSTILTVIAMAGLGLGCDLRAILRAGGRLALTVTASLVMLIVLSVVLIRALGIQ